MHTTRIILLLLFMSIVAVSMAETNAVLVFHAEKRAGAVVFVDECLTRGLTNSMSLAELRQWATNTIQRYRRLESILATNKTPSKRYDLVKSSDIPKALLTLHTNMPSCKFSYAAATNDFSTIGPTPSPCTVSFFRSDSGEIEALSIYWYIYGVIVGPESFVAKWVHDPWYHRKLADGVYLWHGYK
jgi:hypothetical protein